jgi:acylphosphatase
MDTLSALDPLAWLPEYLPLHPAYKAGNALGWLSLENKQASTNYPLAGRLYVSKSGWLMLSVPNALVRGVYDALVAPGAELPGQERSDVLNAHISVMTAAEVSKIGPNKINERGHNFHYTLGALREITINKAGNLSRVWAIQISSPQLSAIRKSYGLSPLPNGDHAFHITVACRRKGVLLNNSTSKGTAGAVQEISRGKLKAASADEITYDCGCSGSCMCPDTCVCKKTGCARKKTAAVYNFEGDVQGVNLRKTLHQILDERKHPGLAYNNAHTGEARAIIPGKKKHQEEILGILRKRLAERATQNVVGAAGHKSAKRPLEEGVDYSITPLPGQRERMHPVTVTPDDVQNFVTAQGFDRLGAEPPAYQNQWLGERYRLTPDAAGNLVGAVPGLAKKQLFHGAPIYGYQTVPGWKDTKAAAAPAALAKLIGQSLGMKGVSNGVTAARSAFKGPLTTLGNNVPAGAFNPERQHALQVGNNFLQSFKPDGFHVYAGRVKTPQSIAGNGGQMTNDLLGFRLSSNKGYGDQAVNSISDQLTAAGVQINKSKMLRRPGYHGWNIAGTLEGAPVEFQVSPRRLQGLSSADHSMVYKPHESGVLPAIGRNIYGPAIRYGMNVASPMVPIGQRATLAAGGVAAVGGGGIAASYAPNLLPARVKKNSAYPSLALQTPSLTMAKGARHEYTNNDQVTKEIAPDHLPEEPAGYQKVPEIEKPARPRIIEELLAAKNHSDNKRYGHKSQILRKLMEQSPQDWVIDDSAPKFQGITHTPTKFRFHTDRTAIPTGVKAANTGSVYGDHLTNMMSLPQPIRYAHDKPLLENVRNNLADVKHRGDFTLRAKRNLQQYRAAIDPKYRYQLAMQAFNGQMEQPALVDQIIEQHGDRLLNMTGVPH